jgi:1-acyl-sn-glycerol-3-phosphate acyltransferase
VNSENNLHHLSPSIDLDLSLTPQVPPGLDPRDRKTYYTYATPVRRAVAPVILGIFHLRASIEVSGAKNLPRHDAVILVTNHLTNFDGAATFRSIPPGRFTPIKATPRSA